MRRIGILPLLGVMVVAMCCGLGCAQEKDITHGHLVTEVTLEEAAKIIGRAIPVPGYLPSNYKVQRSFIKEEVGSSGEITHRKVILLISGKKIEGKVETDKDLEALEFKMLRPFGNPRIIIEETWETEPHLFLHMCPYWHKQIEINGIRGLLTKPSFWTHAVGWCLPGWNEPAFEILITSRVTTRAKTLIKIAESMIYVEE
jgi:hypothetical protein